MKQIICPECSTQHNTFDMRLKVKTGFSCLKCKNKDCSKVTLSSMWRCRCNRLWTKCPVHVHEILVGRIRKIKGTKRCTKKGSTRAKRGTDAPMPVKRRALKDKGSNPHASSQQVSEPNSIVKSRVVRLKPGSILANRFPHLVQADAST